MINILRRLRSKIQDLKLSYEDRRLQSVDLLSTVRNEYPANLGLKNQRKLCVVAHFDFNGKIADYVLHYCKQLGAQSYDVILVSTSPNLCSDDISATLPHVRGIIHRENIGYDFVSWRVGIQSIKELYSYDELLLTNDSIFGPFAELRETFAKIDASPYYVSGLTDNWEKCYHLQSYFLHFKKEAFHSKHFRAFWDDVRIRADKESIILNYEVGLSQHLIRNGFKLHALFPFHEVRAKCLELGDSFQYRDRLLRQPVNSTIFMWDVLLRDFGFPFIKTELLKTNRFQSVSIPLWRQFIPKAFEQVAQKSEDYLKLGHENCRV